MPESLCVLDPKVRDALLSMVNKQITVAGQNEENAEAMDELYDIRNVLKKCETEMPQVTSKKGRKLSAYQVYMSECMRKPEKGGRGLPFSDCIGDWKKSKAK